MSAWMAPSEDFNNPTHRTADISASERIFDRLEDGTMTGVPITHDSRLWLETAIDPFHDSAMEVSGQPSYDQQNSICQVIKVSKTFSAPTAGRSFDLHVCSLPTDTTTFLPTTDTPLRLVQRFGNNFAGATSTQISGTLGMITVAAVDRVPALGTNESQFFPDASGLANSVIYTGISPCATVTSPAGGGSVVASTSFCNGLHRFVAAGFEIAVNTPLLYRGGLATCYQQATRSQQFYANALDTFNGGVAVPYADVVLSRAPPARASDALLLPDSRQWDASLGAYCVLTQNGQDNPFVQPTSVLRVFDGKDVLNVSDATGPIPVSGIASFQRAANPLQLDAVLPYLNSSSTPFSTKGVILSRLHPDSVITVTCRFVMERVPTISETDLVVMARLSPAYDEMAWRYYSEAVRRMPPGVPLDENFTGQWFRNVAKTMANAAKKAAPVLSHVAQTALPLAGPKGALAAQMIRLAEQSGTPPRTPRPKLSAPKRGTTKKKKRLSNNARITAM